MRGILGLGFWLGFSCWSRAHERYMAKERSGRGFVHCMAWYRVAWHGVEVEVMIMKHEHGT